MQQFSAYLPAVSFLLAALALWFSLVAAFPGLKNLFAAVRDGILWMALFFVLGGAAYIAICALERKQQQRESSPVERTRTAQLDVR